MISKTTRICTVVSVVSRSSGAPRAVLEKGLLAYRSHKSLEDPVADVPVDIGRCAVEADAHVPVRRTVSSRVHAHNLHDRSHVSPRRSFAMAARSELSARAERYS